MTSPVVNLTGFSSVELEFYFYSFSMENGEDFWVRYYNGSTYTTVAAYAAGTSFTNNSFWVATVTLTSAQVNFVSNARFRLQCDASDNNDDIYIDAVTLTGFTSSLPEEGQKIAQIAPAEKTGRRLASDTPGELSLYPNPASDNLRIDYDGIISEIQVISATGEVMKAVEPDLEMHEISVENIPAGIYILMVRSGENWIPKKFVKL
jgi:hypothetical protein